MLVKIHGFEETVVSSRHESNLTSGGFGHEERISYMTDAVVDHFARQQGSVEHEPGLLKFVFDIVSAQDDSGVTYDNTVRAASVLEGLKDRGMINGSVDIEYDEQDRLDGPAQLFHSWVKYTLEDDREVIFDVDRSVFGLRQDLTEYGLESMYLNAEARRNRAAEFAGAVIGL